MADNTLFSGLKRLIFKDVPETEIPEPVPPPLVPETRPDTPAVAATTPPVSSGWTTSSDSGTDETTRAKAYQLLESINQSGVDFMEVWNATTESGGPAGLKAAFNALKYADKTLTREKVLTTGRFYIDRLQKALTADLEKKTQSAGPTRSRKSSPAPQPYRCYLRRGSPSSDPATGIDGEAGGTGRSGNPVCA